jgi:capsular polysaccharide biosynthesis protein
MIILIYFYLLLRFLIISLFYIFRSYKSNNILYINNRFYKSNNTCNILYNINSKKEDLKDIEKLIKNKVDNLEYQEILDKLKQKYPDAFKEGIKNKKSLHEILIEVNEYLKDDIDSIYNKLAKKAEVD